MLVDFGIWILDVCGLWNLDVGIELILESGFRMLFAFGLWILESVGLLNLDFGCSWILELVFWILVECRTCMYVLC